MDKPTPFLATCILTNRQARNKSIGINNSTSFTRGLSSYVGHNLQEQSKEGLDKLVRAAYLKSLIEQYRAMAKRLTEHILANLDDADTRNEGIYAMTRIEATVTRLGEELEALWQQ